MRRMFYVEHPNVNQISKHFGVHYSAVIRAINQDFNRRGQSRVISNSIIKEFYPIIRDRLEKYPRIKATRIHAHLKNNGFKGSYNTVVRAVRKIRPKLSRAYVPVEVLPGEEAQMDWAHFGSIEIGKATRKVYCFVMTLSWSRATWAELTMDMTTETLLRCHARAFEYFQGVPKRVLYDNMKTVVIERIDNAIRYNAAFLEFSSWYCYEPRVCDPYQPQQKGRVERFIRIIRDDFLSDYDMVDIDAAKYEFRLWLFKANARPWPGGKHTTIDKMLAKERRDLTPGPSPQFPPGSKRVRSGKTPLVIFDLNKYTIKPEYVRQDLLLLFDEDEIKIYSDSTLVASHRRSWSREQIIRDPDHIVETFKAASRGQGLSLVRHLLIEEIPIISDLLQKCLANDLPLSRVLKTLSNLRTIYGTELLTQAISEALSKNKSTPEAVTSIVLRLESDNKPSKIPLSLPDRPGISDLHIKSHDLSEYDNI